MRTTTGVTLAAVLLLGSAACAGEREGYGATTAGPTKRSTPSLAPLETPSAEGDATSPRTHGSPCRAFAQDEVSELLGLDVGRLSRGRQGPFEVCTWRATERASLPDWLESDPVARWADGVVTITRGRAGDYEALATRVTATAQRQKADGLEELSGVGDRAFAIGASVSGVPIWYAVALHGDLVTAVQLSGVGSNASIATVSDFLHLTIARS